MGWVVVLVLAAGGAAAAAGVKPAPRVTEDLVRLHAEHAAAVAAGAAFRASDTSLPVSADRVTIDAVADGDAAALAADLTALGAGGVVAVGRIVSAQLPIAAIPALDRLASLRFAHPSYHTTAAGLATSQGDQAMRADVARATSGVDGSGVMVGALSDSFNCKGGAAADVASGDLPPTVTVLQEGPCATGTDEGRAMLQIVHDVAPGAGLAFATAFAGAAGFANNILGLAEAGASVILDDVGILNQPMFQDGIVAQAVDTVVAHGVTYLSSAGNSGRMGYESAFRPGPSFPAGSFGHPQFFGGIAHDFDPGPGTDVFQRVTIPAGGQLLLSLQWDSPFFSVSGPPGTQNDVDVYVLNAAATAVVTGSAANNLNGDAVEIVNLPNPSAAPLTVNVMIVRFAGASPGRLKYVLFRAAAIEEHATDSGTIFGHANAAGAIAVGAARYSQTPAFGTDPAVLEPFSSRGPTPILFTATGAPTLEPRPGKPDVVAPDGVDTTFFGSADPDTTGFPNFFGTSAAAPHAAAVAALLLQSAPGLLGGEVRTVLQATALDMAGPGFDNDSGAGLVQADGVLAAPAVPLLELQLNQTTFAPGDTMVLTATLAPGLIAPLVDVYIAVQVPDGSLFSLQPVGAVPGIAAVATGLTPLPFAGVVVTYRFTGAEPGGTWVWYAALARNGGLNLVGGFQQLGFTLSP